VITSSALTPVGTVCWTLQRIWRSLLPSETCTVPLGPRREKSSSHVIGRLLEGGQKSLALGSHRRPRPTKLTQDRAPSAGLDICADHEAYDILMKRTRSRPRRRRGISRIDQPSTRTHGWFVRAGFHKRPDGTYAPRHSKFFGDFSHGGKRRALRAAQDHLAKLERRRTRKGTRTARRAA